MPSPQVIGNINPLKDLDKKVEINPNVIPYLQYKQDLNMYADNGGVGGTGGTNYQTFGSKSFALTGDDKSEKSKDKSNYIPNTGDPYIDGAFKFGSEAEDIIDEMTRMAGEYAKEGEDGWYRPDERFSKLAMRLQTLLNLLTALAMIWQAKTDAKKNALLQWQPEDSRQEDQEGEQKNLLEMVSSRADKHAKACAKLAKGLYDFITKQNDEHKKVLLEKAQKEAHSEAQSIMNDIGDFFGLDSTSREENEIFAKKKEAIEKEYEKVQKEITKMFERLKISMAQYLRGDKTDPFSSKMADVMDKTDESALIKDAGSGYQDINKDNTMAHSMWFTSLQNTRMAYYKVMMAKQRARNEQSQEMTGIKYDDASEKAVSKIMSDAAALERYFFVSYLNQVQTQIAAHNEYITAIFEREKAEEMNSIWTNPWFCLFAPIAGHLLFSSFYVKLTDWIRLECFYADHDNRFTPSELNMDNVYEIIEKLADSKREVTQKVVNDAQKFFDKMEKEMLRLEEEISKKGAMAAPDGMKAVNWNFVNEINERYATLQRIVQGVLMLLLAKAKSKSYALKKEPLDDEWVKDAIKTHFTNNKLALDLKVDTIKKQVEENNRKRAEELEVEKARDGAIGGIIGVVVAVVLIAINVVTFGAASVLTVLAYAGFIAACSAAGSALGELIYQYSHPVHENIYGAKDFYDEMLETDTPEKTLEKALNESRARQQKNIDSINSNSFIDAGRGKRALDVKAVIKARDKIAAERIRELAILMIAKTIQNSKAVAAARLTGGPVAFADFGELKACMEADNNALMNAFEYKVLMANDEINLHNAKVDQEKAISDAWVSFGISTASAVCSAASSAIGTSGYQGLIKAGSYGKLAVKAGLDATQVGLRTYELIRAYEYSEAKYGTLIEDTRRLNELIDDIFQMTENMHDSNMRKALREAAKSINTNLIEGIGDGRVAINMKYFFRIMRKIDVIYNTQIAIAMVKEAKAQARARAIKAPIAEGELIEALYSDLERAKAIVQHLYQRLEDYVKFVNAVAEAKKQLIMKAAAFAVFIVQKADQVLDGKITESITKVVDGEVFGFDAAAKELKIQLPSWLSKILRPGGKLILVPRDINFHDVMGMAVNILLSENVAQRLALLATKQSEKGLDKKPEDVPEAPESKAPAKSGDATVDALNMLEHRVAMAEENMGDLGLSEAKFEVYKSLKQELKNFFIQMISEMPRDYKAAEGARKRRYGELLFDKAKMDALQERIQEKLANGGKFKPAEIKELRAELNKIKQSLKTEIKEQKQLDPKNTALKSTIAKRAEMIKELKVQIAKAEADLQKIAPVPPPAQAPQQAQEVSMKEFKKIDKNTSVLRRRVEQLLSKVEKQLDAVKQNGDKPVKIEDLRAELARLKKKLKEAEQEMLSLRKDLEALKSDQSLLEKQIARLSGQLGDIKQKLIKGKLEFNELYLLVQKKIDILNGGKKAMEENQKQKTARVQESKAKAQGLRKEVAGVFAAITRSEQERNKKRENKRNDSSQMIAEARAEATGDVIGRHWQNNGGLCA